MLLETLVDGLRALSWERDVILPTSLVLPGGHLDPYKPSSVALLYPHVSLYCLGHDDLGVDGGERDGEEGEVTVLKAVDKLSDSTSLKRPIQEVRMAYVNTLPPLLQMRDFHFSSHKHLLCVSGMPGVVIITPYPLPFDILFCSARGFSVCLCLLPFLI